MLAGPSGISRKSTVITTIKHLMKDIYMKVQNDGKKTKEELEKEFASHILREGTLEGIMDKILYTGHLDYHLINDEFGLYLSRAKANKSYLHGSINLLSSLYNGLGYEQELSRRGVEKVIRSIPDGIYFTMLTAMQDPELYIDEQLVRQGFMRRILLVPVRKEDYDISKLKPFTSQDLEFTFRRLLEEVGTWFANTEKKLIKLRDKVGTKYDKIVCFFDPDAEKIINRYSMDNTKRALEDEIDSCEITKAELLVKLSMLECLCDEELRFVQNNIIRVTKEHVIKAKGFLDKLEDKQRVALESVVLPNYKAPVRSEEYTFNKILSAIQRAENCPPSYLLQFTNMTKQSIKPYIETLVEQGRVFMIRYQKTGARPGYLFTTEKEKAEQKCKELMSNGYMTEICSTSKVKEW
jgi:predicted transcriptional regulator